MDQQNNKYKSMDERLRKIIIDINSEVKRIVDIFRLVLKYKMVLRGRGIEFSNIREYLPTDDASLIDWKVSVRMSTSGSLDKLFVKVYEEERDLDVILLVDMSSTMDFGTQDKLKREYATLLAGTIATASLEVGDKVGFIGFNNNTYVLPPSKEDTQKIRILKVLADKHKWNGAKDLKKAIDYSMKLIDNRSFLFIISDFISVGEDWINTLRVASRKFDGVLGVMIKDIRDVELPEGTGFFRFKDPISGRITEVNIDKIREEYNRLAKEQEKRIENIFHESGAGIVKYYTNQNFVKSIVKWFDFWAQGRT